MAALSQPSSRWLRPCALKCLISGARAAEAALQEDVGGQGTGPRLAPHREIEVRFGLASSSLVRTGRNRSSQIHRIRMSLCRKSLVSFGSRPFFEDGSDLRNFVQLYSTEASPNDEEVTDDIWNHPTTSPETFTSHIFKLCKDGNLSSVPKFLVSLHGKGIFLGFKAYHLLLAAASEKNDIDLSCQVFKHLLVSHDYLSSDCYLNLAKAFLRTSDFTELLRFVKEVAELTFPRSTIIMNRIILSFSETRQIDKALFLFVNMKSLNCKPDLVTCNTILDMLGRAGRVDEMLQEFGAMKEAGIAPDIVSYNTLLNSLRKVGRFDTFKAITKEMERTGVEPDLLTYTALIETFGRSGNIERSLRLFSEMKLRQIRPSLYTYRSLISNLKKMGKFELAMTLSEEMESSITELAGPKDFKPRKRR